MLQLFCSLVVGFAIKSFDVPFRFLGGIIYVYIYIYRLCLPYFFKSHGLLSVNTRGCSGHHGHGIQGIRPCERLGILATKGSFVQVLKQFTARVGSYKSHIDGCQNYGPGLGPYYNTSPNI